MKVSIFSRADVYDMREKNNFPKNTAVVSFYEPEFKKIDPKYDHVDYTGLCSDVVFFPVDDLDIIQLKIRGMKEEDFFPEAEKTVEFIYSVYEKGMDIAFQCELGQSRSAGCAAAVLEHFYHTGITVFADYKRVPSQLMYNRMFKALEKYKEECQK